MTPEREDEHRTRAAKGLGGAEAVLELLAALDETRWQSSLVSLRTGTLERERDEARTALGEMRRAVLCRAEERDTARDSVLEEAALVFESDRCPEDVSITKVWWIYGAKIAAWLRGRKRS